jgi:hypothetical protein
LRRAGGLSPGTEGRWGIWLPCFHATDQVRGGSPGERGNVCGCGNVSLKDEPAGEEGRIQARLMGSVSVAKNEPLAVPSPGRPGHAVFAHALLMVTMACVTRQCSLTGAA